MGIPILITPYANEINKSNIYMFHNNVLVYCCPYPSLGNGDLYISFVSIRFNEDRGA